MEQTMEHAMETNIRRGYIGTIVSLIMENQCSAYYKKLKSHVNHE